MYQSIKENKASSSSKQGQHATAGSGANKAIAEGTTEPEDVMVVEVTWMQPYLAYMINNTLPEDVVEAQRIVRRSKPFVIVHRKLYKKSITCVCKGALMACRCPPSWEPQEEGMMSTAASLPSV
jgi:hypothetical protein